MTISNSITAEMVTDTLLQSMRKRLNIYEAMLAATNGATLPTDVVADTTKAVAKILHDSAKTPEALTQATIKVNRIMRILQNTEHLPYVSKKASDLFGGDEIRSGNAYQAMAYGIKLFAEGESKTAVGKAMVARYEVIAKDVKLKAEYKSVIERAMRLSEKLDRLSKDQPALLGILENL